MRSRISSSQFLDLDGVSSDIDPCTAAVVLVEVLSIQITQYI